MINKLAIVLSGTALALTACGKHDGAANEPANDVNILADAELRQGLKEYSNWPTFPQLYVGGKLVGGCDIVSSLNESGELDTMLASS